MSAHNCGIKVYWQMPATVHQCGENKNCLFSETTGGLIRLFAENRSRRHAVCVTMCAEDKCKAMENYGCPASIQNIKLLFPSLAVGEKDSDIIDRKPAICSR